MPSKHYEVRHRPPLGHGGMRDYSKQPFCEWHLLPTDQVAAFRSMVRLNPRCYEMREAMLKPGVWRVGLFWSSGSPGYAVRMLAEGAQQIIEYQTHKDFIRWVHFSKE